MDRPSSYCAHPLNSRSNLKQKRCTLLVVWLTQTGQNLKAEDDYIVFKCGGRRKIVYESHEADIFPHNLYPLFCLFMVVHDKRWNAVDSS